MKDSDSNNNGNINEPPSNSNELDKNQKNLKENILNQFRMALTNGDEEELGYRDPSTNTWKPLRDALSNHEDASPANDAAYEP
jgi:hypothetical protein